MGKRGSVAEYSAYSAWLYYGNYGTVNGYYKYNSNGVRPVLASNA